MFNPVAHYGYLLPNMYLFIADIANTYLFVLVIGPGFVSTSPTFVRSSANHQNGRLAKTVYRAPLLGAGVFDTISQQFMTVVTAPPLVGCVVWSLLNLFINYIASYSVCS